MAKFSHPLGLTAYEYSVIIDCYLAHEKVPNGHFLPSPAKFKAGERMAEKGYLTLVDRMSPTGWPVFMMTLENLETYNAALAEAQKTKERA
ncbi:MAG TPA: hypothetical protein VK602_00700 [Phyllobacterium sp.]|nr:hypothetical protein [Phyllobacterium sp.]